MDRLACLTVGEAHDIDGGGFVEGVDGPDIAGEVRCDHGAVHPRAASQRLEVTTVEGNTQELAIERPLLPTDKVELAALLIQRYRGLSRPIAAGELPNQSPIRRI